MSRNYSVTEPHPSVVQKGGYLGSGRGGAGNYGHYKQTELTSGPTASGPAARASLLRPQTRTVIPGGRGGAGNMRRVAHSPEPEIFQFDEEMVKRRENAAPTYHIGRGGAANFVDERNPGMSRMCSGGSTASVTSDKSTASSVRRSMEGAFGRLTRTFSKNQ